MLRRQLLLVSCAALMSLGVSLPSFAADSRGNPETYIVELSNEMLDVIRGNRDLIDANPQKVREFVSQRVMPVVDFLRMTRMCVGPKWREASTEQRATLQHEFREQLTRVYSTAFATLQSQRVKLAPNHVKATEKDALVRTILYESGKPDMRVDYRLKKVDGQWRIIDVNVEGIWFVENYRNQFAGVLNSSGIDGLIKTLKEKNAAQ